MSDSKEINTKIKGDNNTVNTGLHLHKSNSEMKMPYEDFQRRIELERKDAIEEHKKASDAEKVKLEQKIAELDRRLADLPQAFEDAQVQIAELKAKLEREGNEIGAEKLAVAITALEQGDFSKADELFAEIEAREELAVKRSARAAYARGEIAEQEVRWYDAAEHYARAAQLDPCFENLINAHALATEVGTYDSALSLGLALQEAAIKEYGKDTQQYAHSLNNIGLFYSQYKKNELAEPLFKEALKIRENIFGKKHPEVAISLNNLGGIYQEQEQYREATYFLKRALNIHKEVSGVKYSSTATTLNNLGGAYSSLGELKKAKPLFKQALKIRKELLGDNHPYVANSYNSLGTLYSAQGQDKKAEPHYWQALKILEATLGPDHPNTILVKKNYEALKKRLANTPQ